MTTIDVKNPVTGSIVGTVPNLGADEVHAAVQRARAAQPEWEARGVHHRSRMLRLWANELWRARDELIRVIRDETGKNKTGAMIEILVMDNVLDYYAHHTPGLLKPRKRRTLFPLVQYGTVYYKPYGVAGFITPWNYPYLNGLMDAAPALAAGNTVIIKPSEITPFTVLTSLEIAHRAGIPVDVLQAVTGDGKTGAALVDEVDCIHVTGSTTTGRKVAQRAAERLIPFSLELGGKDPMIVLDDADLDMAASTALSSALENAGQVCVSTERIYVLDSIYDTFVDRLCHYATKLTIGPGDGFDVDMGSMTNERELLRVEQHITDAVNKGAKLIWGGKRRPDLGPLFLEPAILVDVNHRMDVMREETFGPIVPVMRVSSTDEAIRLANDSPYGLSGSVFTNDLKKGERVARQIKSGDISVNRSQFVIGTPSLPSGGRKDSGLGRRGGPEGLMRFVAPQSVLVDRQWVSRPFLTQLDPFLLRLLMVSRALRRYLPFLRPGI
jgi:succinate-semialdehyde dehydrogenase/glutarate-semialdehyde dehydrogenase